MYLKRLELYGFKTFSKKTVVEFSPGFLAVVGPNGSGKSNLTDAIRFCLGESNLKALRATRLDELVFAGTPTIQPAAFAEVTVVFDNSDEGLPVEAAEVAITRRLEKGGESRFQINRTNCRLKDVHELLMGSGVGPGSFSVLGGKEVDQVLSTDPTERRLMLEETAGVNRYRFRKKEAQRRLQRAEVNLTRLRDIHKEVESQLDESERQLKRYERYKKNQTELRELDVQLARHEWSLLKTRLEELQDQVRRTEEQHLQARQSEETLQARLDELQSARGRLEQERESANNEYAQLKEGAGGCRAAHAALFQRASVLEHAARAADTRHESASERIDSRRKELGELEARLPDAQSEFRRSQAAVAEIQAALEALPAPDQGPYARLRTEMAELEKEKNGLLARCEGLKARSESDRVRLAESREQESRLVAELGQATWLEEPLEQARTAVEAAQQAVLAAQDKRRQAETEVARLRQERKELEGGRRPLIGKLAELEALLEDRSGLPPAVQNVMGWKEPGTIGLVGELVTVPEGLEQAYEAALGGHLHDIITRDRHTASRLIERLKKERAGRATFWPLDLDRRPSQPPELPDRRGVVGRALELLGYSAELKPVLEEILGKTVIMEDLPVALAMYERCRGRRPHLVTREGEYLSPSGALTGGMGRKSRAGLLSRRRLMEDTRARLQELEDKLRRSAAREEKAQSSLAELEAELKSAREAAQTQRERLADLEAESRRHKNEIARSQARLEKLRAEIERLGECQEQAQAEIEASQARARALEAELSELAEELARHQEEESRLKAQREQHQLRLMEARVEAERRQQRQEELEKTRAGLLERLKELDADRRDAFLEKERSRQQRAELETEGGELQARLELLEARLQQKGDSLEQLRRRSADVDKTFAALKKEHQSASQVLQEKAEVLHGLQVELAGVEAHAEDALGRLADYGEEPPRQPATLGAAELDQIRGRAQRLRSFLESFGSVNLGAREEHERLTTRFQQLGEQIRDLDEGAASLKSIMAELDRATVSRFEEAFRRVNDTFGRLFSELFGGGSARLELCDPEDLLESGVEIVACPPGKKLQNLTLLSSGERALSAMAFLLSLLACKPSPVVVLDELDAPLDDSNVEKVAGRLLEFSTSSQFLVITHNRKTMEFADRLYGVTMEQPGISRLLSVELKAAQREMAGNAPVEA
ncbi:MAG: chromosome segregation protein SMC [Armatimonadetes bacterium]|nr:chromosome segregation protein SMC [Armatimonadota bacterium]